jgi:hypothetical protein
MVRFICLEISTTGVFAFECAFSVRSSSLVHRLRLLIFLPVFAIKTPVFKLLHRQHIEIFISIINLLTGTYSHRTPTGCVGNSLAQTWRSVGAVVSLRLDFLMRQDRQYASLQAAEGLPTREFL